MAATIARPCAPCHLVFWWLRYQVFTSIEARGADSRFRVTVSFLEIYTEMVKDLLHPGTNPRSISIRETPAGGIVVQVRGYSADGGGRRAVAQSGTAGWLTHTACTCACDAGAEG